MTFITWACLRCVQKLATILGPQNPTLEAVRYMYFACLDLKFCFIKRGEENMKLK